MSRLNTTIPDGLLKQVDDLAIEDFTTRSEIVRRALIFYLRATGETLSETDADALLKAMRNRQLSAYLHKIAKQRQ